ncbi:MAG: BamA/TamA family outer membrane protein [Acidobacteria bacterium]|nr:BamA/TamA family outer membrane protein [Acidobacteriota bacterium]
MDNQHYILCATRNIPRAYSVAIFLIALLAFNSPLARTQSLEGEYFVTSHDQESVENLKVCTISPEEMKQSDRSRLLVQLTFKNGKPQVALPDARLRLTKKFCLDFKCQKSADGTLLPASNALLKRLLKRLNAALASLRYFDEEACATLFPDEPLSEPPKPPADADAQVQAESQKAFNEYTRKKVLLDNLRRAINSLEMTARLRSYNGSYAPFFQKDGLFEQWRTAVLESPAVIKAFKEFWKANGEEERELFLNDTQFTLNASFSVSLGGEGDASRLSKSAINLIQQGETPDSRYGDGLLCHRVTDPVVSAKRTAGDALADTVTPEGEKSRVIAALEEAGLIGLPWSQEEMIAALEDFYTDKGDEAKFEISGINDDKRTIKVLKRQIDFIRLPKVGNDELYKVLQHTLSRKEFYEFVRNEQAANEKKYLIRPAADELEEALALGLKKAPEPDVNDAAKRLAVRAVLLHYNFFTVQRLGAALRGIDYMPVPIPSENERANFFNLTLMKTEDVAKNGSTRHPNLHSFLEASLYKVCPQNNNYFFGGLEYRPGQGVRGLGGYKCFKAGPGNVGFEAGGNGAAIGNLSYAGVVPFFGTGPGGTYRRPLFLQIEGSSLYERNRLFGGVMTNERRTGVMLRAVLPILGPAETRQFDLMAVVRRQTVTLTREEKTVDKLNLTTIELGARFFSDKRSGDRPAHLELTSLLKLGLGAAAKEPVYSILNLGGTYHIGASRLFEFNVKGLASIASNRTPVVELPSFGGSETVRGFRKDDALGRRLWSVQPEIRLRARGLLAPAFVPATGGQEKLRKMVRDSLALAFFSDIGGVYRTFRSPPGVRYGPGLGIRFKFAKQATLRLDWAYGIGDGVSGKGRGRFYFSFDLMENPF